MKPEELVKWLAEQCPDECAKAVQEYIEQQAEQLRIAREAMTHPFLDWVRKENNRTYDPKDDGAVPQGMSGSFLEDVEVALAAISDPSALLAERDAKQWERAADFVGGYNYLSQNFTAVQEDMRKEAARIRADGGK